MPRTRRGVLKKFLRWLAAGTRLGLIHQMTEKIALLAVERFLAKVCQLQKILLCANGNFWPHEIG
jgi:hypothetical protein